MLYKSMVTIAVIMTVAGCSSSSSTIENFVSGVVIAHSQLIAEQASSSLPRGDTPFSVGSKDLGEPALASITQKSCDESRFKLSDITVKNISFSNRGMESATSSLSVMGYNTLQLQPGMAGGVSSAGNEYVCSGLPLILTPVAIDESSIDDRNRRLC